MATDFIAIRQLFHINDNNGFSENEILAYKNVCEHLPKALIDYYQQLGKCPFNHAIDYLLHPNEIYWFEKR